MNIEMADSSRIALSAISPATVRSRSDVVRGNFSKLCQLTFCVLPAPSQVFVETFVVAYIPDVSEPQASFHIAVAFVVLIPACVFAFEGDIPEPPRFSVLRKFSSFASFSSSHEAVDRESVHSSIRVRTNYGFCSKFSNVDRC